MSNSSNQDVPNGSTTHTPEQPLLPFKMFFGDENGQIHNGDVPVTWCASKQFLQSLELQHFHDPHVVICSTSYDGHQEMQRQIVPLGELMTFVRFTKAGRMKVFAWVIDGSDGRKELHRRLYRFAGAKTRLIHTGYNGNSADPYDEIDIGNTAHAYDQTIEIPKGIFGKEPSPLIKWYTNLWHDDRIVDECHFRRRMILAFTLKWIPFFIINFCIISFRVSFATVMVLAGLPQEVRWLRAWRPYKYPSLRYNVVTYHDDWKWAERWRKFPLFVITKKEKDSNDYYPISFALVGFVPLFHVLLITAMLTVIPVESVTDKLLVLLQTGLVISGMVLIIEMLLRGSRAVGSYIDWLSTTGRLDPILLLIRNMLDKIPTRSAASELAITTVIGALILLIIVLTFVEYPSEILKRIGIVIGYIITVGVLITLLFRGLDKYQQYLEKKAVDMNKFQDITPLLCPEDGDNIVPVYQAVPKERRSLRLWYLDTKNKMCKPMQF